MTRSRAHTTRSILAVLAALICVALVYLFWFDRRTHDASSVEGLTSPAVHATAVQIDETAYAHNAARTNEATGEAQSSEGSEPAGGNAPDWFLRYTVVDDRHRPAEGARIFLRCNHVEGFDQIVATDELGRAAFSFPAHGSAPKPEVVVANASLRHPGYADVFEFLRCEAFISGGGTVERRLELVRGGTLRAFVVDQSGNRVAQAVVLLHLDRSSVPAHYEHARSWIVPHYRLVTDATGLAEVHGMFCAEWSVIAGNFRNWYGSERESVLIDSSSPGVVHLAVERWDPATYASGVVLSPSLTGDGGDAGTDFYLRHRERTRTTRGLFNDGAFFIQLSTDRPEPWELVEMDGTVHGEPLLLVNGDHSIVIDLRDSNER